MGLWLSENEAAKSWLSCLTDLKNRGLDDIFVVCITERNIWKCFKCDEDDNQLDLYAAVTGLPIYQASLEHCEKLGIEPPWVTA